MKSILSIIIPILAMCAPAWSAMDPDIIALRQAWEIAKYRTPEAEQEAAFEQLAERAAKVSAAHPDAAEAMVWQAIILASQAGAQGGLGALSLVKQAKVLLERAEQIDPSTLDGSVYTSLGSLYYQVPGWPIGFGDDDKAESYLQKALAINPDGIDPNFFYGDFLLEQGEYARAVQSLERALQAPDRPGREIADAGRRGEVMVDLARARRELD